MSFIPSPRAAWANAHIGRTDLAVGAMATLAVAAATATGTMSWLALLAILALAAAAVIANPPPVLLLTYVALIPWDGSSILGDAATLSRLAGIGFGITYLARRRSSLRVDILGPFAWAFTGIAVASFLWSIDRSATVSQGLTLVQLFLISLLISDAIANRPALASWVAAAFSISAVGMGLLGIWAYFFASSGLPAGRAQAFPGQDSAQYAAMLIPAFLVLVWYATRSRARIRVALASLGAATVSIGILLSGTRSAWVAVGLVLAVGLVPRMTRRQNLRLAGVGLILGVIVLVTPSLNVVTFGRLAGAIESGGTGRTDIWQVGLGAWTEDPIAGVGYGSFPAVITPERIRATAIATPDTGFLAPPVGPHSILVGTLVELGIVGLICLIGFLWTVVRSRAPDGLAQAARLAVLAVVVQGMFLDILGRKQVWLFIAIAMGLAAAARERADARRTSDARSVAIPDPADDG